MDNIMEAFVDLVLVEGYVDIEVIEPRLNWSICSDRQFDRRHGDKNASMLNEVKVEELTSADLLADGDLQGQSPADSSAQTLDEKSSKMHVTKKIQNKQKKHKKQSKKKAKNILINYGTALRKFIMIRTTTDEHIEFENIFGTRTTYKGMREYTRLFQSKFHPLCLEFFNRHAKRWINSSNVSKKSQLIKYIQVMRKAVINKSLDHLD